MSRDFRMHLAVQRLVVGSSPTRGAKTPSKFGGVFYFLGVSKLCFSEGYNM